MATANRIKKGIARKQQQKQKQTNQPTQDPKLRSKVSINSQISISSQPQTKPQTYKNINHIHTDKLQQQYESYYQLYAKNPVGVNYTSSLFPNTYEMNASYNIPLGFYVSPMLSIQNENTQVMEKSLDKIPRCAICRTYMNCYNVIKKKKFTCFFCYRQTNIDGQYAQQAGDQMKSSIYQVLSPPNFYVKQPMEQTFIFFIDITKQSSNCKMLYYFVAAMKEILSKPEMDELCIYFFTFDQLIRYYDFTGEQVKCTIIDQAIQKNFQNNTMIQPVYLKDARQNLLMLLDQLEQISQNNQRIGYNFSKSFEFVFNSLKHTGAKFIVLQSNQALINDKFFNEKPVQAKNKQQASGTKSGSYFQSNNKQFFEFFTAQAMSNFCSISFFSFARNFKNLKNLSDGLKITGSELKVYMKDNQLQLDKFYYQFSYTLSATYFKSLKIQFLSSAGWHFIGIYGNAFKLKQQQVGVFFQLNYVQPSRKLLILVSPSSVKNLSPSPFCGIQLCINYQYKRQCYATVATIIQPVTGYMDKMYNSIDPIVSGSAICKKYLSALRIQPIEPLRKKMIEMLSKIYISALNYCKKPDKIPNQIITVLSYGLALLKSVHSHPQYYLGSHTFDRVVGERNLLQFSGSTQVSSYFNPYVFDISNLQESQCQLGDEFTYPPTVQAKFRNVKQGLFLLDNGVSLYLFIAKQCDPDLLMEIFGKSKFSKQDHLQQQNIMEQNTHKAQQLQNLIKILRQQKMCGWIPLHIVRCGQNTLNEKNFYLNFYAQKYQQSKSFKFSLQQFIALISKPNTF